MVSSPKPTGRKFSTSSRLNLLEEVKRQTGQLTAINTVTTAVTQSLDLNMTLQTALEAVLTVIPVDASGISMVDESAGELVMKAQRGWKHDFTTTPMRIRLGEGLSGRAVTNDEVVITGDVSSDPRLVVPEFMAEKVQAQILAPMHARGKVIGILSVMSYKPYEFDENEVTVLCAIADQVGLALDNARLYEAVKEQQSRLQAVLQSTADAIIATDNYGIINLFNQAAEVIFEASASQMIGHHLREAPLPPSLINKLRESLDPDSKSPTFEIAIESGRHLAAVVSPVYTQARMDEQRAEGWVVVFQDITHLKEAERGRLQFTQMAAHDLRNPLAVTLSALTMLHKNITNPTPTQSEVMNIALNGINRMQDLIDDLLNLEHIESGLDLHYEEFRMSDLIERCMRDMEPVFARREQIITWFVDPSIPIYSGDDQWLYRAFTNLLSNAHKYTQKGGKIAFNAALHNHEIVISVEDNGPGIPLDAQARLFERFYRVYRSGEKTTGTGLGLAIVKSVAEKHSGRVFVQSEVDHGSIFGMVLPLERFEA
jgi:PAS domain S-box-containing protein